MGLAAQPAHALQPRLGRSRRQALVGAQKAMSGGTSRSRSGPATTSPISHGHGRLPTGPAPDARGKDTISGIDPFIMQADGKGWLFVPAGLQDGPLPTHYEPQESVMQNPLYGQQCNPGAHGVDTQTDNPYHQPYDDPAFPLCADHLSADRASHCRRHVAMADVAFASCSRKFFARFRRKLAAEVGLKNGGWATIRTARAEIEARVLVTQRVRALKLNGRTVHQIGMPYHWASKGLVRGDCGQRVVSICRRSRTCRSWKRRLSPSASNRGGAAGIGGTSPAVRWCGSCRTRKRSAIFPRASAA